MGAIGWKLDRSEREQLLRRFPPRYSETVADHVTLEPGEGPLPPEVSAAIVGRADDGAGVEAMVVSIDGATDRPERPGNVEGRAVGPGRRAKESNRVLRDRRWTPLAPVPVTVRPATI